MKLAYTRFTAALAAIENAQENGALYPYEIATIEPRAGDRLERGVWVLFNHKSYFVRPSGNETVRGLIPDIGLPHHPTGSADDAMVAKALDQVRASR